MKDASVKGTLDILKNGFDKDTLQNTVSFTSLFVLAFEAVKFTVIKKLLEFYGLSKVEFRNGEPVFYETEEYKQEVRKLAQKPLHASLCWFVNHNVISDIEFERMLEIESRRNSFVHELFNTIWFGISEKDKQLLDDLMLIYKKIDSWWIFNVDLDWEEVKNPEDIKMEDCHSIAALTIDSWIDILINKNDAAFTKFYEQAIAALSDTNNKDKI